MRNQIWETLICDMTNLDSILKSRDITLLTKVLLIKAPGELLKHRCSQISKDSTLISLMKSPAAAAAAKSLQSYPTLCDPIDESLPGSPVPGILQARTLEWVAISFSNA